MYQQAHMKALHPLQVTQLRRKLLFRRRIHRLLLHRSVRPPADHRSKAVLEVLLARLRQEGLLLVLRVHTRRLSVPPQNRH